MKFFSIHKFIAIFLTISFVGTSILAPLTAQAEAQKPIGGEFKQTDQKHDITDIFSDPKMQRDAFGIVFSCAATAYADDAIALVTKGASKGYETLQKAMSTTETTTAAAPGTTLVTTGTTRGEAAGESAVGSQTLSVPVASIPISQGLTAITTSLSGINASIIALGANAQANNAKNPKLKTIADCLVYGAGQLLLKQLTNNIVAWIKGGFHGSPSFAVNTHEIFLDLADMVAGDLAREIRGVAMCKFRANFQNDLANNIELSAKHIYKFNGATKCPFPETLNLSSSDFYKGVNQFSWGAMEYAMRDSGNPHGVALLSGQELALRSSEKADVRKQELSWSNGFTNMVDTDNCDYPEGYTEYTDGTIGYTAVLQQGEQGPALPEGTDSQTLSPQETRELQKTYCKTTTPGKLIADQFAKVSNLDLDRLGAVDSLNKIIGALIERLTQDASMGIFKAVSGQQNAKVQQNYIAAQDKTVETIFMENYAIKSAKDALAAAQKELADAQASSDTNIKATIPGLQQKVAELQKNVDNVASPERSIARQTELNTAHQELTNALAVERSAQAQNDTAQKAYYTALQGTLDGGVYIQPDPTALANLKMVWNSANDALVRAQGITANARQRLFDAQHPVN